jgi:hypothetical protein
MLPGRAPLPVRVLRSAPIEQGRVRAAKALWPARGDAQRDSDSPGSL